MFKKKKKTTTHHCAIVFFLGGVEVSKAMVASVTFFDGFGAKKRNDNCHHLFQWFCYITFFYGGGAMKKAMATSPSFFYSFSSSLVLLVQFIRIDN
jgi:hypothetical protein